MKKAGMSFFYWNRPQRGAFLTSKKDRKTMATVYIGSDHAGLELKAALVKRLSEKGHDVHDLGPATTESCDYPVYAKGVCGKVLADAGNATPGDEPASFGILVCGTGIGMSMTANHIPGIRAALCTTELHARFTRLHNNANVLCLGARVTGVELALAIVDTFLSTEFEGGRHQRRIDLLNA
mgnify:CR=1 FL=1